MEAAISFVVFCWIAIVVVLGDLGLVGETNQGAATII
jgi:hypothetical protein